MAGHNRKHLDWPTPATALSSLWGLEGHAESAASISVWEPSGSFVVHSVIAVCNNAKKKGRVPIRKQFAWGTHAASPVSIKKKKQPHERKKGKEKKILRKKKAWDQDKH